MARSGHPGGSDGDDRGAASAGLYRGPQSPALAPWCPFWAAGGAIGPTAPGLPVMEPGAASAALPGHINHTMGVVS